jgi:hypothetical protein
MSWVGTENYEMRVAPDAAWIDKRILAILRKDGPSDDGPREDQA